MNYTDIQCIKEIHIMTSNKKQLAIGVIYGLFISCPVFLLSLLLKGNSK